MLAHVFDRLREAGINVEETENIIFADAEAAVARISIIGEPPAERGGGHQDRGTRTSWTCMSSP